MIAIHTGIDLAPGQRIAVAIEPRREARAASFDACRMGPAWPSASAAVV